MLLAFFLWQRKTILSYQIVDFIKRIFIQERFVYILQSLIILQVYWVTRLPYLVCKKQWSSRQYLSYHKKGKHSKIIFFLSWLQRFFKKVIKLSWNRTKYSIVKLSNFRRMRMPVLKLKGRGLFQQSLWDKGKWKTLNLKLSPKTQMSTTIYIITNYRYTNFFTWDEPLWLLHVSCRVFQWLIFTVHLEM